MPAMFTKLPTEVVLEIASYLPIPALVSMKLVSRRLFFAISIDKDFDVHRLSQCERNAVRRAINERKHLLAGRRWCLICMTPQPVHRFPDGVAVCLFHKGRFWSGSVSLRTDSQAKGGLVDLPVAPRVLCTHCHTIRWQNERGCWCVCECCPRVKLEE